MKYWLFKSEPNTWGWDDQLARGDQGEFWDGVRNYQARNNMREMRVGDQGFFYHSVKEKRIVGIVEVIEEAKPDHTTDDPRWEAVTIKAIRALERPISLDEIKGEEALHNMILVNNSRLSVQPVEAAEWDHILAMAKR